MTTRRRWTQDSIRHEIAPIVAELGRMPTRRQLSDRGLAAAWSAMQRHGGLAAWRHVLTAPATAPSPAAPDASAAAEPAAPAPARPRVVAIAPSFPSRHDIAQRAYFIAQQRGGDPVANWLAAERELLAA